MCASDRPRDRALRTTIAPGRGALLRRAVPLIAALACALCATLASAAPTKQDQRKADKLYRDARALMGKGTYEPACPMLEESQKLDPAPGTQYQLAVCYENTDRPATALALYLEVADMAAKGGHKDKEKVARDNASALEPKVPRIVIEVGDKGKVSGLAVTRDGKPVEESQYDTPILVDPGDFTIEATAPGKKPFKTVVTVRGAGARVAVPILLEDAGKGASAPPSDRQPTFFTPLRIAGIGAAALGVGGVVAGSVFGLSAKDTYDRAISDAALCPTKTTCYPEGKRLVDSAQSDALVSTVTFVVGGVLLAGGAVLFFLPDGGPSSPRKGAGSFVVVPVAGAGYGGVAASGTF